MLIHLSQVTPLAFPNPCPERLYFIFQQVGRETVRLNITPFYSTLFYPIIFYSTLSYPLL